jgi:hypothetical protein
MKSEPGCPERLSREEQYDLTARLQDLGDIVFRQDGDPLPQASFQEKEVRTLGVSGTYLNAVAPGRTERRADEQRAGGT